MKNYPEIQPLLEAFKKEDWRAFREIISEHLVGFDPDHSEKISENPRIEEFYKKAYEIADAFGAPYTARIGAAILCGQILSK